MDAKKPTRILVLDDELIVCKRLQPVLEKKGYYVETFDQSQDALDRFRESASTIWTLRRHLAAPFISKLPPP